MKHVILTLSLWASVIITLSAQNPVSIAQVGTTPVTTTVPVSGSVSLTGVNNVMAGNRASTATTTSTWSSATAVDTAQQLNVGTAASSVAFIRTITSSGTFSGGTLNFEVTDDAGLTWLPITVVRADTLATETTYNLATSTTQLWFLGIPGLAAGQIRVRLNPAITGTGTVDIKTNASAYGVPRVAIGPIPTGSNTIGTVTGTFWQATQPVSGTFWQATQPVSGTFWQATQPVSGTVTANQGGTWTVQPGNTANTTAWKVDGSAVTQPVSGTFWQATQPVSGTFWQATQPVSGTVTANQGGAPWSDVGTLTNNNAAPAATNLGALVARATAVAPTYTEGNQVLLSTDNAGALRVSGSAGGGVAQTQVRNVDGSWADVGYSTVGSLMPVFDKTNALLAQEILSALLQQAGYLRGTFGARIGSVGDALKVAPISGNPCDSPYVINAAISQTANATIITNTMPGMRILGCGGVIVGADAENISFVEGTGSVCATTTAAVVGGTTAAAGPNMAANGGFQINKLVTNVKGNNLCVFQSGSGRVAGNLVYIYVP